MSARARESWPQRKVVRVKVSAGGVLSLAPMRTGKVQHVWEKGFSLISTARELRKKWEKGMVWWLSPASLELCQHVCVWISTLKKTLKINLELLFLRETFLLESTMWSEKNDVASTTFCLWPLNADITVATDFSLEPVISTIQQVACLTDILTDNTNILTDNTSILTDNTTLLTCALSSHYSQRCATFLTVILPLSCAPHCSGEVGAAGCTTCTLSALTSWDAN